MWQPIETAPKNIGILVWWPHREYYGSCAYAAMHVDMGTGERWMSYGVSIGRDVFDTPTHWMPMPAAPPETKE